MGLLSWNDFYNKKRGGQPPALILGLSSTGLGVSRILAARGIPVIGLDYREEIGFFSNSLRKFYCPHPLNSESEFIEFLIKIGEMLNRKTVVFPTADEFVLSLSRHRRQLCEYYLLNLPKGEVVELLNNKYSFYKLAQKYELPVPPTNCLNLTELVNSDSPIDFPIIIKPYYSYLSSRLFTKGIILENRDQLLQRREWLSKIDFPLIVQKFLKGPQLSQYSYCGYFDNDSKPVAVFISRKIRQNPIDRGVGTYVESAEEGEILEKGTNFLTKIRYSGLVEMEFIRDDVSSSYWAIEVNTRPWTQIALAWRCRINFPYIQYTNMVQGSLSSFDSYRKGVGWVDLLSDLYIVFSKNGYIDRKSTGIFPWLKSLLRVRSCALFSLNDPKPFLRLLWISFKKLSQF